MDSFRCPAFFFPGTRRWGAFQDGCPAPGSGGAGSGSGSTGGTGSGGTGNGGTGSVTWSDGMGTPAAGTPTTLAGGPKGYDASDAYWDSRYAWEWPEPCDRRMGPEQCAFLRR